MKSRRRDEARRREGEVRDALQLVMKGGQVALKRRNDLVGQRRGKECCPVMLQLQHKLA